VYSSLATLLESGVSLERSIELSAGSARGRLRKSFNLLAKGAKEGIAMSQTMREHPKLFTRFETVLIGAGEHTGHLSQCARKISDWYEFVHAQKSGLISNLMLPILVLHLGALLAPLPRVFLMNLNMRQYAWEVASLLVLPYGIAVLVAIAYKVPDAGPLRRIIDHLSMRIWLLRGCVRHLALSRYFYVFSILNGAGFSNIESTRIAASVGGNSVAIDLVRGGTRSAIEGKPISEGFSPRLDPAYLATWKVGEESGMLSETTERLSQVAADKGNFIMQQLFTWAPRVIYLAIVIMLAIRILQMIPVVYGQIMDVTGM